MTDIERVANFENFKVFFFYWLKKKTKCESFTIYIGLTEQVHDVARRTGLYIPSDGSRSHLKCVLDDMVTDGLLEREDHSGHGITSHSYCCNSEVTPNLAPEFFPEFL